VLGQHLIGGEYVQSHGHREQQRGEERDAQLGGQGIGDQSAVEGEEGELEPEHHPASLRSSLLRAVGDALKDVVAEEADQGNQEEQEPGRHAGDDPDLGF